MGFQPYIMKIFSYYKHHKKCPQNGHFRPILETFLIMSLIGEFLYYWSYRHDILPCIVGNNSLSGKTFRFEYYTHEFSTFRKACLLGFGVTEYNTEHRWEIVTYITCLVLAYQPATAFCLGNRSYVVPYEIRQTV